MGLINKKRGTKMGLLLGSLTMFYVILVFVSIALTIAVFVWLHNCSLNLFRIYNILEAWANKNGVYDGSIETVNQIKSFASSGEICYKQGDFKEAIYK